MEKGGKLHYESTYIQPRSVLVPRSFTYRRPFDKTRTQILHVQFSQGGTLKTRIWCQHPTYCLPSVHICQTLSAIAKKRRKRRWGSGGRRVGLCKTHSVLLRLNSLARRRQGNTSCQVSVVTKIIRTENSQNDNFMMVLWYSIIN